MENLTIMFLSIGLISCTVSIISNTTLIWNAFTKKLTDKQQIIVKKIRIRAIIIMLICMIIIMAKYMLLGKLS